MGAGIAASPHCAERRICRCSLALAPLPKEFWPHFSILAHQLRRRFPSDNSLQRRSPTGLQSPQPQRVASIFNLSGTGTWVVGSFEPGSRPKPSDVPRPFLDQPLSRPALLFLVRRPLAAASRLRKLTLPAPLPGWPRFRSEELPQLPAGGDRTFGHLPLQSTLAGFPRRPGPPSRSPDDNALVARVGEAKNFVRSLWITGILGTIVRTMAQRPNWPPSVAVPFPSAYLG